MTEESGIRIVDVNSQLDSIGDTYTVVQYDGTQYVVFRIKQSLRPDIRSSVLIQQCNREIRYLLIRVKVKGSFIKVILR
jgi:hypothetical protein